MAAQLPAEFFRHGRTWFLAGLPISETEGVAVDKVYGSQVGEMACLLLFTSAENAIQYRDVVLSGGPISYDTFGFDDLRRQGQFLDACAQSGFTHIVFDPRPHGNTFVPIGDAIDALRQHVYQPPPSAN